MIASMNLAFTALLDELAECCGGQADWLELYKKRSFSHSRYALIINNSFHHYKDYNYTITTYTFPTHYQQIIMSDAQIAGGHKANINNPNTSQESKEHSKSVLDDEFNGGDGEQPCGLVYSVEINTCVVPHAGEKADKNPGNVAGGLKA